MLYTTDPKVLSSGGWNDCRIEDFTEAWITFLFIMTRSVMKLSYASPLRSAKFTSKWLCDGLH